MDISVNHLVGLRESGWLMSVNTLCFEDGEEIFGHDIVIRVSLNLFCYYVSVEHYDVVSCEAVEGCLGFRKDIIQFVTDFAAHIGIS